jgi:hypothetical protein
MICAFTVDELQRVVDWGHWKQREVDPDPEDSELLERIGRLAEEAAERDS